jgi:nitrate reductase gamma subunit
MKPENSMYIGGGIIGLLLVVALIVFIMRRA